MPQKESDFYHPAVIPFKFSNEEEYTSFLEKISKKQASNSLMFDGKSIQIISPWQKIWQIVRGIFGLPDYSSRINVNYAILKLLYYGDEHLFLSGDKINGILVNLRASLNAQPHYEETAKAIDIILKPKHGGFLSLKDTVKTFYQQHVAELNHSSFFTKIIENFFPSKQTSETLANQGYIYEEDGDDEQAISSLNEALKISPGNPDWIFVMNRAKMHQAKAFCHLEKYKEASLCCNEVIASLNTLSTHSLVSKKVLPLLHEAFFYKISLQIKSGEMRAAISTLEQMVKAFGQTTEDLLDGLLDSEREIVLNATDLGNFYMELGDREKQNQEKAKYYENAVPNLERSLIQAYDAEKSGRLIRALYFLSKAFLSRNEIDNAEEKIRQALAHLTDTMQYAPAALKGSLKSSILELTDQLCSIFATQELWDRIIGIMKETLRLNTDNPSAQAASYAFLSSIYYKKKNLTSSVENLERAYQLDPRPEYQQKLINLYKEISKSDDFSAVNYLEKIIAFSQEDIENYYELAKIYAHLTRWDKAEENCKEYLKRDPKSIKTLLLLASILEKTGKADEALRQVGEVLKLDQRNEEALKMQLRLSGQIDDASEEDKFAIYQQVIAQDPKNWKAKKDLGLLYLQSNDLQKAYPLLKDAVALSKQHPDACAAFGKANFGKKAYAKAFENYLKAQEDDTHSSYQHEIHQCTMALATELLGQGRVDEAVSSLLKGSGAAPSYAKEIALRLLEIGKQHNLQFRIEALKFINSVIAPKDVQKEEYSPLVINHANELIAASQYNEALVLLRKANNDYPNDPQILFILGNAYAKAKQWKESEQALRDAIHYGYDKQKAIEYLKECIEIDPRNSASLQFMLGELCLKQKSPREASAAFESAYELDPTNEEYKQQLASVEIEIGDAHYFGNAQRIVKTLLAAMSALQKSKEMGKIEKALSAWKGFFGKNTDLKDLHRLLKMDGVNSIDYLGQEASKVVLLITKAYDGNKNHMQPTEMPQEIAQQLGIIKNQILMIQKPSFAGHQEVIAHYEKAFHLLPERHDPYLSRLLESYVEANQFLQASSFFETLKKQFGNSLPLKETALRLFDITRDRDPALALNAFKFLEPTLSPTSLGEENYCNMILALAAEKSDLAEYREALKLLNKANTAFPKNSKILFALGACHYKEGKIADCQAAWLQAIASGYNKEEAFASLGKVSAEQRAYVAALNHYLNAAKVQGSKDFSQEILDNFEHLRDECIRSSDFTKFIAIFKEILKTVPSKAQQILEVALNTAKKGLSKLGASHAHSFLEIYAAAAPFLEQLKISNPDKAEIYSHLSDKFRREGNNEQAFEYLKKCSLLEPRNREYSERLIKVSLDTNKLEEAEASLKATVALNPSDHVALLTLSELYTKRKAFPEALQAIQAALKLDSTNVKYLERQYSLEILLGNEYYSKALTQSTPSNTQRLADLRHAAEHYEKALMLNDNYDPYLNNLIDAYAKAGEIDKAYEFFKGLQNYYPTIQCKLDPAVVIQLADRFFLSKQERDGIAIIQEAMQLMPYENNLKRQTSDFYIKIGKQKRNESKIEEALKYLDMATNCGIEASASCYYEKAQSYLMILNSSTNTSIPKLYPDLADQERPRIITDYIGSLKRAADLDQKNAAYQFEYAKACFFDAYEHGLPSKDDFFLGYMKRAIAREPKNVNYAYGFIQSLRADKRIKGEDNESIKAAIDRFKKLKGTIDAQSWKRYNWVSQIQGCRINNMRLRIAADKPMNDSVEPPLQGS